MLYNFIAEFSVAIISTMFTSESWIYPVFNWTAQWTSLNQFQGSAVDSFHAPRAKMLCSETYLYKRLLVSWPY